MPIPDTSYTSILDDMPKQGPLFNSLDTLWETMRVVGYSMSGLPYRPAGSLSDQGNIWASMESDLASEYTAGSRGYAMAVDQRNFAENQTLIVDKILSSLPGGLGGDEKTRATVYKISEYVAKFGPTVINSLRANLKAEDDVGGAMSAILNVAESAIDSMYGPLGSIYSAQSILAGSMRNTVDLDRRDTRLNYYLQNKYGVDGRTRGANARKEAAYLALEARNFVDTGLNKSNENARRLTTDFLATVDQGTLGVMINQLAWQNVGNFENDLFGSASTIKAINSVAKSMAGGNIQQEGALRSFMQQYDSIENIKKDLQSIPSSGIPVSTIIDLSSWTSTITKISAREEVLRGIIKKEKGTDNAKAAEQELNRLGSIRGRLEGLNKSWKAVQDSGVSTDAGRLQLAVNEERKRNIEGTLNNLGLDSNLANAIRTRDELSRRGIDISGLENSVINKGDRTALDELLNGNKDKQTVDLLNNYFDASSGTSQARAVYSIRQGRNDEESARLLKIYTEYQQKIKEGKGEEYRNEHYKDIAQIEDATVGLMASQRDTMRAYGTLEAAFAATGSTIGGQAITSEEQVNQIAGMFLQNDWGHLSDETRIMGLSRIAYGMMASNTNAEQALQYGGLAAKAAREVGADVSSASLYGTQGALAVRQWQAKNNVSNPLLASQAARAWGLAPKTMFGRNMNAILFNVNDKNVNMITDERSRAIVEKARRGEQLTIEEMRTIESRGETILSNLGMSHAEIRNALNQDYSFQEKQYQYVMGMGGRLLMAGSQIHENAAYNAAQNTLKAAGSRSAYQNSVVQRLLYQHSMNREDLLKENAEALKAKIIEEAEAAGVKGKDLEDLRKIDAIKLTNSVNTIAVGQAKLRGVDVKTYQDQMKAAEGVDMEVAQIAADTWSNVYTGTNNAFSKAITALKQNPNATAADMLTAAKGQKLTDAEKHKYSYNIAMSGLMGQPNAKLDQELNPDDQKLAQNAMKALVGAAGNNTDRVNYLMEKAVGNNLEGDELKEWNAIKAKAEKKGANVDRLVELAGRGTDIGVRFIDKESSPGSTQLNANTPEQINVVTNTGGSATTGSSKGTAEPGTTASKEPGDPSANDGSEPGKALWVRWENSAPGAPEPGGAKD